MCLLVRFRVVVASDTLSADVRRRVAVHMGLREKPRLCLDLMVLELLERVFILLCEQSPEINTIF